MKFKKLILSTAMPLSVMPIVLSAGCGSSASAEDFKKLSKEDQEKVLKDLYKSLSPEDKYKFIEGLDPKKSLTPDQKEQLISYLNKDAGNFGGIVWYIKSVESYISKWATYQNAIKTFDKLKAANAEKFDFSQNFNAAQKVVRAAGGKSVPVIFMDIDETVLQNDYTETYGMLNGGYNGTMKEKNDVKAVRFALPGVVDFINYVQEHGGLVFYNSDMNQSTEVRDKVKENLTKVGIKYVADFQFWMRGSMPYVAENEADITDEKTKDMKSSDLEGLAKNLKFTDKFADTPWRTWTNSKAAYTLGKKVYKTDRMNGLDDNKEGWNLKSADKKSDEKVVLKTIMKIGDNYNDFFDRMSKKKSNDDRVTSFLKTEVEGAKMQTLFTIDGGTGIRYVYDKTTNKWKWEKLDYTQAFVMVPGNCEYGGWLDEFGYEDTYYNLYQALKSILNDKRYQNGPTQEDVEKYGGAYVPQSK